MTTPSGLPRAALQFWGAARGAVANRVSTAGFYQALHDAAGGFGLDAHGLTFSDVTQLRSAAVRVRNAAEAFDRAPASYAIDHRMIGQVPYGRDLAAQAATPIYQVGVNLTTVDLETGETSTDYRQVRFTNSLPATKQDLLDAIQQDAEALADTYGQAYAGHSITEVLAV